MMQNDAARALSAMEQVISGKPEVIKSVLTAVMAGGHILLDDAPGVGKTTLALALGKALDLRFARVQCTPDLLPSDIVGYSVYDKDSGGMRYQAGAVNGCNLLLCDEINRASSKTQSALLETMEERQVTVDGVTHPLSDPFIVIATQNNIGSAGTQLLPYAQLDRFMVCLSVGYPDEGAQVELMRRRQNANPLRALAPVMRLTAVRELLASVQAVYSDEKILRYIARLAAATRGLEGVQVGLSPRAALHLDSMSKARACLSGRDYVIPEDVQAVFADVGCHRVLLTAKARMVGKTPRALLQAALEAVPVPDQPL